jgi:hypothetical protein
LYRWSFCSNQKANAIVADMLTAMGGEKNYNAAHFIQWDFVNRKLSTNGRVMLELKIRLLIKT